MEMLLTIFLVLCSLFLILIILVQRGRGGGLAGAFGGMGGQSAFGTRAGDVFTKITIGVAVVWVLTAGVLGIMMRREHGRNAAPTAFEESADAKKKVDDTPEIATQPENDDSLDFGGVEGLTIPAGDSANPDGTTSPETNVEPGSTETTTEPTGTPPAVPEKEKEAADPAGDGTTSTPPAEPSAESTDPDSPKPDNPGASQP